MTFANMPITQINSITKYPAIPTYHPLVGKGVPTGDPQVGFDADEEVVVTEKINGVNARIIVAPDGDWLIGSRETLLTARGDRVQNSAHFITETLCSVAEHLFKPSWAVNAFVVYYVEVFGCKVTAAGKEYTHQPIRYWRWSLSVPANDDDDDESLSDFLGADEDVHNDEY